MRASIHLALFIACAPTVSVAQATGARAISDDSAIYVLLIAPSPQTTRGRAAAAPLDLRRATDAQPVGRLLASRVAGFDTALVTALHQAPRTGRGPGVALRGRPELLWREPRANGGRTRVPPDRSDGWMERVEHDPRRIPLTYSVVQYSADRTWALLFEDMYCGPLCGASRYVVLRRDRAGWTIVSELVTSVS